MWSLATVSFCYHSYLNSSIPCLACFPLFFFFVVVLLYICVCSFRNISRVKHVVDSDHEVMIRRAFLLFNSRMRGEEGRFENFSLAFGDRVLG